jgi:LemA protein
MPMTVVLVSLVVAALVVLLALLLVLWGISMYNNLVQARLRTSEAWSGIDVQLKRRASLIPNVVESVRGYAQHEHEVFAEVAQARGALAKAVGPVSSAIADQSLTQALGRLMAVAENYPQLQAATGFHELREELRDAEEKIAYARQFYNGNVLAYNTSIRKYPGSWFARRYRFEPVLFFSADEPANQDVKVSFARA